MQNTMLDSTVSNSMQLFQNAGFKVRVVIRDGDPWFVAKDVCDCLAIADASQACKNLDDDEKQVVTRSPELSLLFRESSKAQAMMLISESGLYTLIMRSNKPEAKVFRKWVTSEVLPIFHKRRNGRCGRCGAQDAVLSSGRVRHDCRCRYTTMACEANLGQHNAVSISKEKRRFGRLNVEIAEVF